MSVSGISNVSSPANGNTQITQSRMQQFRQVFQQLGQDLQSGNLPAAQSDILTLQQSVPPAASTTSSSKNRMAQDFSQLSADLKSGNISAAQKDYSAVQQDFQNRATHRHHHHGGGGTSGFSKVLGGLGQAAQFVANFGSHLLGPLGVALQSGNLSAAQQAYSAVQQAVQQLAQNNPASSQTAPEATSSGISLNA
jgi:ribosomal protein S20